MKPKSVEDYAQSLLENNFYSTIDECREESVRWHKKLESGLMEPMKCQHKPNKGDGFYLDYRYDK